MASAPAPTVPDPLAAAGLRAERVNYATGVLLQAEDFQDEQTYHRGRLAMALRHLVGFGTIAGLRVRAPAEKDAQLEIHVDPGLALDRLGRLIQIDEPYCLRLARWFAAQDTALLRSAIQRKPRTPLDVAVVADVFLSAADCGRGKTPSFASGPFDALDALVPARLAEQPQLTLVPRAEGGPGDIPSPANFWPAPNAKAEDKLAAVLGAFDTGVAGGANDGPQPLQEHVEGNDLSAVLLARVAIPVTLAADAPTGTRPVLDLTKRTRVDNGLRPFIYLPGKWLGLAPAAAPLVEP
ncbi:MAG: hypothetical protein JO013_10130 [Alphaproteobacteria bacterium]|nr:hypothetical protein [Alphaproteobacteria bacterium]